MVSGYPKVPTQRSVLGAVHTAAIPEADLSFDTSAGHDHDGSNSKSIQSLYTSSSAPSGVEGQIYYDTDDDSVWVATE